LSIFTGKRLLVSLVTLLVLSNTLDSAGLLADDEKTRLARAETVSRDLQGRDITDPQVLEVMGSVPRHLFIDPSLRRSAYGDHPLPISEGQTISQPYIVALMTQVLSPGDQQKPVGKVLEVGTGSGYQAAVLSRLVPEVYSMEIREGLAESSSSRLKKLGYDNIEVRAGDGYFGWPEQAPFDAIMITAAVDHIPGPLKNQLADGGRLILPLGSPWLYQTLTLVTRVGEEYRVKYITAVSFVPMVGEAEKK